MVKHRQYFFFLSLIILISYYAISTVWAAKSPIIRCTDLNYHYAIDYIGSVNDFSDSQTPRSSAGTTLSFKILIELSIESIRGGFDWIPMNPLITDNSNRVFRDYKVVVEPPAGEKIISVKYIVTPAYPDSKQLTFYEEGISEDGKKAYRVFLRNIPLP